MSIALVISPLIALMEDQVAAITSLGVSAVYLSDKQSTDHAVRKRLCNGDYQLVFMSPEALFASLELRRLLLCTNHYRSNMIALVVDEAHCVKKW